MGRRVLLMCTLIVSCCALLPGPRGTADEPAKPKFEMSMREAKILELTNAERAKEKLDPLKSSAKLFEAARSHSANMAKQGKLEHVLDDKTPFQRIKATGYLYKYAGENLAQGIGDPPAPVIIKGWMDSPKHRMNLMKPEYTEIGLGCVVDDKGTVWYTQVFGKPRMPQ